MEHGAFAIGKEFWCGGKRWRCTDIGTRVIVAICLEPHEIVTIEVGDNHSAPSREIRSITDDPKWLIGPPYAVGETVFDEYDIEACSVTADAEAS